MPALPRRPPALSAVATRAPGGAFRVTLPPGPGRVPDVPPARTVPHAPRPAPALRQEIQALRTVAVLTVVVYHLWPAALPGGFIGVDVFFVISGFLITSLLLREIDQTGRISLARFWARRARRILPAAIVTLAFCAVATLLVVPLNHWQQFLGDVAASTLYVQNWHLSSAAVDYFRQDLGPSPVQHFWSLAVEEQFYLVWPLLLIAAVLAVRGRSPRVSRGAVAVAMGVLTVASLVYSIRHTAANPAAAYFVTPARAWEFGAGGLLALLPRLGGARGACASLLSWAGLGAIFLAAFIYTRATPFPGVAAILPVLGALAVMGAGMPARRWSPAGLLRLRPVQFVGDTSYAVYLWHWPLIILAPFALGGALRTSTKVVILMLTIVLAWLSKVLIEDPLRSGGLLTRRRARWTFASAIAATGSLLALTACGTSYVEATIAESEQASNTLIAARPACFGAAARDPQKPCTNRLLDHKVVPTPTAARSRPNAPCQKEGKQGLVAICSFGVPASKAVGTIAIVGDSHASHWRAALIPVAEGRRWRGLSITHSSCPLSRATRATPEPTRSRCERWKRQLFQWFSRHPEVKTLFVAQLAGGSGVLPARGKSRYATAVDGYRAAWNALPRSVERIIVLRDTPRALRTTPGCVTRAMQRGLRAGTACAMRRGAVLDRDPAMAAASRMRSRGVAGIDMTRFMCGRAKCFPVVGGALVHKDVTHITAVFGATLGPFLLREVDRVAPREPGAANPSASGA